MNAAVDGLQPDDVNARQEISNGIHNFNASIPGGSRKSVQPVTAIRNASVVEIIGDNATR